MLCIAEHLKQRGMFWWRGKGSVATTIEAGENVTKDSRKGSKRFFQQTNQAVKQFRMNTKILDRGQMESTNTTNSTIAG